jgi:hypothetical protein
LAFTLLAFTLLAFTLLALTLLTFTLLTFLWLTLHSLAGLSALRLTALVLEDPVHRLAVIRAVGRNRIALALLARSTGRRRLRAGLGFFPSLALLSLTLAFVLARLLAPLPPAPLLLRARLLPVPLLVAGISAVGSLLRIAVLPRLGALGALVVAGALLLAIPLLFVTTA